MASLLFAAHPAHVQAVTYIAGRADLLASLFMLLNLFLFIRISQNSKLNIFSIYLYSVTLFILAILSKEMALVLPILLITYYYVLCRNPKNQFFKQREFLIYMIPFFIISTIYIICRVVSPGSNSHINGVSLLSSLPARVMTLPVIIMDFLKIFFLPVDLHLERTIEIQRTVFSFSFFISIILMSIICLISVKAYKHSRTAFFGICWFFLALLPVSNAILPINAKIADHWLYLPSIGLCLGISLAFSALRKRASGKIYLKMLVNIFFIFIIFFLSLLTIRQNTFWKNDLSLYQRILTFNKDNDKAKINLGLVYLSSGQFKKAQDHFESAIKTNPANYVAYKCLGNVYTQKNQLSQALEYYKKSIELYPEYSGAHLNMGVIYYRQQKYDEALTALELAIRYNPYNNIAYHNLGIVYKEIGKPEEALSAFQQSYALNPDHLETNQSLIDFYKENSMLAPLIDVYKNLLKITARDKRTAKLYSLLAIAYEQHGDYELAIKTFLESIRLFPQEAFLHNNLGILYTKTGLFKKSKYEWETALQIDPEYKEAQINLNKLKEKIKNQ
ncbi:MAG: tetratricopeptide repeat protein [Candidatus Omnitrophota bacterium]